MTGSKLRKQRLYFGLTQKEMAHYFGVSRGTYSAWESRYKNRSLPLNVQKAARIPFSIIPIYVEPKKESIWKRILRWIKN